MSEQFGEHVDPTQCGRYKQVGILRRTRLKKRVEQLAEQGYAAGVTDRELLASQVLADLDGDENCKSILVVVGVSILSAVVQWLVKRWLDKRHPEMGS